MSSTRGHQLQAAIFRKGCPADLARRYTDADWADFELHWNKFPDTYRKSDADEAPLADRYVGGLREDGAGSHSAEAVGLAFRRIVRAFADGDDRQALMWAATIQHFLGDASDTRHIPMARLLVECLYSSGFGSTLAGAGGQPARAAMPYWDLASFYDNPVVRDKIDADMEAYRARVLSDDPTEAAVRAHVAYYECWTAITELARVTISLSEAYVRSGDAGAKDAMDIAAASTAVESTRRALDLFATADALARAGQTDFDEAAVRAAVPERVRSHLAGRDLNDTVSFHGLVPDALRPAPVGFLVEYPFIWKEGVFQYPSTIVQSMLMRRLRDRGDDYAVIRDTDLAPGGALMPKAVSALVVFSGEWTDALYASRREIEAALEAYLDRGGRILWLGGRPPERAWRGVEGRVREFPAEGKYASLPFGGEHFAGTRIEAQGGALEGTAPWPLTVRKAFTAGLGDFPPARFYFEEGAGARPLLRARRDGEADGRVVAAEFEVGEGRVIYAPFYLMLPNVFTDRNEIDSLTRLDLDEIGRAAFDALLARLTG